MKRPNWTVQKLDTNPKNYTFNMWCRASDFNTWGEARAFVDRAESPTQRLRVISFDESLTGEKY